MAFLGSWEANETLTLYLQTVNPDTGAAWNADTFPTFRVYHLPTGTPIATGTYARQDIANTTGFYVASLVLSPTLGFVNGQMYGVRTAITIVGMTAAQEDQFQIPLTPFIITPARIPWRAQSVPRVGPSLALTPAQRVWKAQSLLIQAGATPLVAVPAGGNWGDAATWFPAVIPTAAHDCLLTATSGPVTLTAGAVCRSLNCTGYANVLTHPASVTLNIGDATAGLGNVALAFPTSGWTYTLGNANSAVLRFISTSTTQQTLDFGGKTTGDLSFAPASGGSWLFTGDLGLSGNFSVTRGTLDLNGRSIICGTFASNNSNVRSITFGTATLRVVASATHFDLTTTTNLTWSALQATIILASISASTKTFHGGGLSYGTVQILGAVGAGPTNITGSNTFTAFSVGAPKTVRFTAGTTTTFLTPPILSGTPSALITISSVTAATHTLSLASGLVEVDWIHLTNSVATGGATWNAHKNSIDNGGNSGWNFTLTFLLVPARLMWSTNPLRNFPTFPPARLAWAPQPMGVTQNFPFRELTPALDTQTNLAAFLAAVSQNVIIAEAWLIQSQRLGLRLSFGYAPDASWEHRILDMSDIEITVAPGGGLATAANVSFTVAETGEGQSMLQLWHRFATIGGKADITIDFHLATGVTFRMFTGLIDTITVQNGRSQVLCVDESIQRNLQLPQRLVTPDAYPLAASGALTQPVPLVYGQGSHLQAAPLLFTNTSALAYTAAAHPMTLTSVLAVFNADAVRYMPGNVPTTGDGTAATVFLQTPLQQTLLNAQTGPLAIFTQENVTNAAYVLDGNDATIATIGTTTLASNLDGQGFLGIIATPTSNQQGNNQAVITLTNHRRSVNSDPTVTGQFLVQTVIPATGQVLRSALFTTQNFRHSLNPQTTQQTIPNLTLGAQEAVEVLLLVRNEGGPGLGNNYYEVGGISIQTGYLPQGDTFPIFLYQGFDGRRDATGLVTQVVNTLYTVPSHVIGSLLSDELGLTLSTTFPLAHTFYTNASYLFDGGLGYSWFVTRAPVRQILDDAARQAIGILSPDLVGQWNIRPFQSASPLHFAFTPYNILCVAGAEDATASDSLVLTLGNMANVHCRFEVHYRWNVGAQKFDGLMSATETGTTALGRDDLRLMCQLSALRYGVTETLIIQAYWITDTTTAMQLLAHLVRYFSFQRLTVTFDTTFQALSLQLGDFISVTHPLLPVGDTGGAFEVHTMRTAPVAGRVTLTCSKIAAVFLEYFTIRDQNGVVWYFWFDTAGDLARDTVPPAIFPFQNTDLTGSSIPWWHQVSDPLGGTWFLWPDVDGALTIDSAPPAFGLGLVTGLGQTAVALNTHTYRLGAGAAQEITIEDLG